MKIRVSMLSGVLLGLGAWAGEPVLSERVSAAPAEVALGATHAQVVEVLGEPSGLGRFDARTLLSYERGTILLVDGKVTQVDLVNEATWKARQVRKQEEALVRAKAAHVALQAMLASPHFAEASLEVRVRRWSDFRKRWPSFQLPASFEEDMSAWRERVQHRRAQEAQELRLAGLERRVAEAEWAARDAERKANAARLEAERSQSKHRFSAGTSYYVPSIIYSDPYCSYPTVHRTPSRIQHAPKSTRNETKGTGRGQIHIQHRPFYQSTVRQ